MKNQSFLKGISKGLHIAIGYIPIGISFGLIAKSLELPNGLIVLMSMMVYAGASQFMAVGLLAAGISGFEIIITTFIVNFRHFLMSASLSSKLHEKLEEKALPLVAFGITDETFAYISMVKSDAIDTPWVLGLNVTAYLSWVMSTMIGIFLSASLPEMIQSSMGISLYAMFIGLLIPKVKESHLLIKVVLLSILMVILVHYTPLSHLFPSDGWRMIGIIVSASSLGAFLFPEAVDALE